MNTAQKFFSLITLFFLTAFILGAQDTGMAQPSRPVPDGQSLPVKDVPESLEDIDEKTLSEYLGLFPRQIIEQYGAPDEVFSVRGDSENEDNAVFYYFNSHRYFFFFKNRVWQIRYDKRYADTFYAKLSMGMSSEKAVEILGEPLQETDKYMLFRTPFSEYPVRIILYFGDEGMEDFYYYRSDW